MEYTPTPHNSAKLGQIAKTVIMPGDPLRSKMIADTLLDNAVLVNNVRGVQGYTGTYRGVPITVMAHGMGNPSMGIYSYELFKFYDVANIIRVGTIGSLDKNIALRSIILGEKSFTTTNYDDYYIRNGAGYVSASPMLLDVAKNVASKNNLTANVGKIWCSETFYTDIDQLAVAKEHELLGVEMEVRHYTSTRIN